jgi:uncharacterized delta-60 repeat protein
MSRKSQSARVRLRFTPSVVPLEDRTTPAAGDLDLSLNGTGKQVVPFDLGGGNSDLATAVAVQADGKIVLVGSADRAAGNVDFAVTRLNRDGSLDATFGTGGKQTIGFDLGGTNQDRASAVAIQADGKIVVAGSVQRGATADFDFGVARLNPDGSLDAAFDADGKQTVGFDLGGASNRNDTASGVAVQADGKIVVAGSVQQNGTGNDDFAAARLNADGSLDATFGTGGKQTVAFDLGGPNTDDASAIAVQADGKIVLAGSASRNFTNNFDFAVARLNANGSLDAAFGTGGKQTVAFDQGVQNLDQASAVAVQADGKILVAGFASQAVIGDLDFGVARLNPDGSLDTAFDADGKQTVAFNLGGINEDRASAVAVQADGKVVVGGSVQRGGAAGFDFGVARLNPDGGLDATFNGIGKQTVGFDLGGTAGTNADLVAGLAIQADRNILLAGSAQRAGSSSDFAVARLLNDNRPPVAVNDVAVAGFNAPVVVAVLANDSDPDGNPLTVAIATAPANGTAVANPNGTVTYTPNAGFTGVTTFTYTVSDGQGGTSTASVNVTVSPQPGGNRPPVAVNDVAVTGFNAPVVVAVLANDSDPDGNPLTVAIATAPANGTAVANPNGTVTYTPNAGFIGTNTFTYSISDGQGGVATASVNVTVSATPGGNRPPVAVNDVAVTGFNAPVVVAVLANDSDPDGNPLTVAIATAPANGTAVANPNGTVTYTPNAGFAGPNAFTYTVSDGQGGTATATVTVTVLTSSTVPPSGRAFTLAREFGVGLDRGGDGTARLLNPDQTQRFAATPFAGSGAAGVRTTAGDFNGDGVADLVVGTGPGGPTRVRILDGKTQAELFSIDPFEAGFTGGVFVATGDVTGDGVADLIITPDEGGGPRVRIFSGRGFGQVADFFGIDDPAFRGGARGAVADLTGDGVGDLLVSAGFGGGPRVAAFNGTSLGSGTPVKLFGDFLAFEPTLRNGVFIAGGDLNGDGFAELIVGGGPGGGPRVLALDGKALVRSGTQVQAANFFAGDSANRGGVRLAVKNLDGDGRADLVVGSGPGGGSRVTAYAGKSVAADGTPPELFAFDAQVGFTGGVFVG